MLTYSIAVADHGQLPHSVIAALRKPDRAELPFEPDLHVFWQDPSSRVAAAFWEDDADTAGLGSRFHRDEQAITAFSGLAWPGPGGQGGRTWATRLARAFRPNDADLSGVRGVFTAVHLRADGSGVVASDDLSLGLVYQGHEDGLTVFAPRADLAASILAAPSGAAPRRDPIGACWLAFSPYALGERTGFENVSVVSPGSRFFFRPGEGVLAGESCRPPWEEGRHADPEELLDALHQEVAGAIRMALDLPVRHFADLTGGKDSRLVLAVMFAENLHREFEFATHGGPALPDVAIAQRIIEELGLQRAAGAGARPPQLDLRTLGERGGMTRREAVIRLNAGSWSGMRSSLEPRIAWPPDGASASISGLGGEILRTNFPSSTRLRSMSEVDDFAESSLRFGAAGILKPDAYSHYAREARRMTRGEFGEQAAPQDAIDAFYLRNRMRRWFGTGVEVDFRNRIFPLLSSAGVQLAFSLGPAKRHSEWIHFKLMNRTAPILAELPFDKGGWDPALLGERRAPAETPPRHAKRIVRTAESRREPTESAQTVQRAARRKNQEADLQIMQRYLVSDPSNPVFELVDHAAVIASIERFADLNEPAKLQVYGALTAAIWLGENELSHPGRVVGDGA